MRIRNPAYVSPAASVIAARRPAVDAFIKARSQEHGEFLTLADIRASFPAAQRAELTDAVLMQMLADLGHRIEP